MRATDTALLRVDSLVKRYADNTAVDGLSFSVPAGCCFGLLGPNGAGKTTTIEIMEGILAPTAGTVLYRGAPLGERFRAEAGILFQKTALQDFLTVRQTLQMFRGLYDHGLSVDEVIRLCSLEKLLGRDNKKLSGGQLQRLLLGVALVNDPQILFLDEPTTGLDPQARRRFWELVQSIKAQRKTIILTTHYMEEAQLLCDEIVIVDHGRSSPRVPRRCSCDSISKRCCWNCRPRIGRRRRVNSGCPISRPAAASSSPPMIWKVRCAR